MQRFLFSEYSGTLDGVPNASPARGRLMLIWPRMEQAARPGTVLIAPATLHLVEGFVAVKSLGPVPVKGRSKPVEVYELSGIGPARTRLQAAARRGLTRFVGRDTEIEVLRRSLERAGPGHGQVVAIVGEAGVGKSRLVREFTRSQRTDGWLVLERRVGFLREDHAVPARHRAAGRDHRRASRRCSAPDRRSVLPCRRLAPLRRLSRDRTSLPATDAIATRPTNP
jgi:AAA ATPase domain